MSSSMKRNVQEDGHCFLFFVFYCFELFSVSSLLFYLHPFIPAGFSFAPILIVLLIST